MRLNEIIKLLETNEYHNIQQAIGALKALRPSLPRERGSSSVTSYIDAGCLGELEVEINFFYTPKERQTWWEPGCPEDFEIYSVVANIAGLEVDVGGLMDDDEIIDLIKSSGA